MEQVRIILGEADGLEEAFWVEDDTDFHSLKRQVVRTGCQKRLLDRSKSDANLWELVDERGEEWPADGLVSQHIAARPSRKMRVIRLKYCESGKQLKNFAAMKFSSLGHSVTALHELWYTFSSYSLRSSISNPRELPMKQFHTFCNHCAFPGASQADMEILFKARARRGSLDFSGFLDVMKSIAHRAFPALPISEAMSTVIRRFVAPHSSSWSYAPNKPAFKEHTTLLGYPRVQHFLEEHLQLIEPLFLSFARSRRCIEAKAKTKEGLQQVLDYPRYLVFVSYFRLPQLGMSSMMLSEVFLSCSSFLSGDISRRKERDFTKLTLTDFVVLLSRLAFLLVPPQEDSISPSAAVDSIAKLLQAIYVNGFFPTSSFRSMCRKLESCGWSNRYHFVTASERFKLYFLSRKSKIHGKSSKELSKGRKMLSKTRGHDLEAPQPQTPSQGMASFSVLDHADAEFTQASELCLDLMNDTHDAPDVEQISALFNAANIKYTSALRDSKLSRSELDGIKVRWSGSILSVCMRVMAFFNLGLEDTGMYGSIWLYPLPWKASRLTASKLFRVCDLLRAYLQQSSTRLEQVLGLSMERNRLDLSLSYGVMKEYARVLECSASLHVVLLKFRLRLLFDSPGNAMSVSLGRKVMHDACSCVGAVLETLDNLHPYLVKQSKVKQSAYAFWSKILFERGFVLLLKLACAGVVTQEPYLSPADAQRYEASADLFFAYSRLLAEYTCELDPSSQRGQQAALLWVWESLVDKDAVAKAFLQSSLSSEDFQNALPKDFLLSKKATLEEISSEKAQAVFQQLFRAYNKSGSGRLEGAELEKFKEELQSPTPGDTNTSDCASFATFAGQHLSPVSFQSYLLWTALTHPEKFLLYLARAHWHNKVTTFISKLAPIQKQMESASGSLGEVKTGGVEAMYEILLRSSPVVDLAEVRQRFHVDLSGQVPQMEPLPDKDQQQVDPVSKEACLVDYFVVVGAGDVETQPKLPSSTLVDRQSGGDPMQSPNDAHFSPEIVSVWPPISGHADTAKEFSRVEQLGFALMQQEEPFPEDLPMFCFPYGLRLHVTADEVPPESYSFTIVLTDTSGIQRYGTCFVFYEEMSMRTLASAIKRSGQQIPSWVYERTSSKANELHSHIYAPTCLCILSRWPFHAPFQACLNQIFLASKRSSPTPVERYIKRLLYETPVPPKGLTQVQVCIGDAAIYFSRPGPRWNACEGLCSLLSRLSIENVLFVIAALLQEKKVALCTCNIGLLTPVAEALMSLLFPFQPQCVYIPVLPEPLYDFLFAPVPFLMGLHATYLADTKLTSTPAHEIDIIQPPIPETEQSTPAFAVSSMLQPSDVIFVDLDNDRLVVSSSSLDELTMLPEPCRRRIVSKLKKVQANIRTAHGSALESGTKEAGKGWKDKLRLKKYEVMEARKRDVYVNPLSAMSHKEDYRRTVEHNIEEASNVFAQMFVTIFLQYRKYLEVCPHHEEDDLTKIFDVKAFLQHHPLYAPFCSKMIDTQLFHHFIYESSNVHTHNANVQLFHDLLNARQSKIKAMAIVRSRFALTKDFLNEIRETYFVPDDPSASTGPMWTYRKFPVLDPEKLRNHGASKNHIIPIVKIQADASLITKELNAAPNTRTTTSKEFAAIIEATTSRISKRKHNDVALEPSIAEAICRDLVHTVVYEAEIEALHRSLARLEGSGNQMDQDSR